MELTSPISCELVGFLLNDGAILGNTLTSHNWNYLLQDLRKWTTSHLRPKFGLIKHNLKAVIASCYRFETRYSNHCSTLAENLHPPTSGMGVVIRSIICG